MGSAENSLASRNVGSPRFESRPGLSSYAEIWEYQKVLVERRARDEIPDTFLFVEHPPTITRGRGLQRKSRGPEQGPRSVSKSTNEGPVPGQVPEVRAMPLGPLPAGTEYFEIERGGDLTWHGPGQLVIYPIVKLDGQGFGPDHDVTGYLRKLERIVGAWLANYGLETEARADSTGIWVRPKDTLREFRKIASIGIAVRKWVTYHGIGINLANDAEGFRAISPCGFSPEVMTNLAQESAEFSQTPWSESRRCSLEAEIAETIRAG